MTLTLSWNKSGLGRVYPIELNMTLYLVQWFIRSGLSSCKHGGVFAVRKGILAIFCQSFMYYLLEFMDVIKFERIYLCNSFDFIYI